MLLLHRRAKRPSTRCQLHEALYELIAALWGSQCCPRTSQAPNWAAENGSGEIRHFRKAYANTRPHTPVDNVACWSDLRDRSERPEELLISCAFLAEMPRNAPFCKALGVRKLEPSKSVAAKCEWNGCRDLGATWATRICTAFRKSWRSSAGFPATPSTS